MKLLPLLYRLASPVRSLYWRILKPLTYGTRVLITHPDNPEKILLIRHSYGNRDAWNIPGGGYNPEQEVAEDGASRETLEEVGMKITDLKVLGIYESGGKGKHDTVTMFSATATHPLAIKTGPEIADAKWVDISSAKNLSNISSVAKKAVSLFET
ncbi:MAG: NUDIX domain-containing protein [Candidatus Pacebacteria bacterium]|nr:NUDIX domain-containing protein [Candidatus Paceibacterota bacterium]